MDRVEVIPARDLISLDFGSTPIKLTNEYDTARWVMDNYCNGEPLMSVLAHIKLSYRMWLNILRNSPELKVIWDEIQDIHIRATEHNLTACVTNAAKIEWRAALAVLERRYPDKWAKKTHHINESREAQHPEGAKEILAEYEVISR